MGCSLLPRQPAGPLWPTALLCFTIRVGVYLPSSAATGLTVIATITVPKTKDVSACRSARDPRSEQAQSVRERVISGCERLAGAASAETACEGAPSVRAS